MPVSSPITLRSTAGATSQAIHAVMPRSRHSLVTLPRLVGWPGGASPPGSHRSVRDSLPSYGSCRPGHLAAGFSQAQWAKYRGQVAATPVQARIAFFQVWYLRYLFMSHRIRQVLMRWSTGVSAEGRNAP